MAKRAKGSVRMGPISLFSLIILLSLAVLAVLTVTTAQANYASAEKQASFTTDTYTNETNAQILVSEIDSQLATYREAGITGPEALDQMEKTLPSGTWIEDNAIKATFYQESGRILSITLEITDDANYEITQWQATTDWRSGDSGDTLWTGSAETEEG